MSDSHKKNCPPILYIRTDSHLKQVFVIEFLALELKIKESKRVVNALSDKKPL